MLGRVHSNSPVHAFYPFNFSAYIYPRLCKEQAVIERRQHQLGRMADFPPPVTIVLTLCSKKEILGVESRDFSQAE